MIADAAGFEISDEKARLDPGVIHHFLTETYWSSGITPDIVKRATEGSWCFGLYAPNGAQAGFARLITDYATFAYLADVFVIEEYRGRGLGAWMMETIFSHPATRGLRRIVLATRDAHQLYKKVGFAPLSKPEIFMEIARPDIYRPEGMRP
jgi:GNAT superfamily N-acetyltransferase